jgi:hypothetical protein
MAVVGSAIDARRDELLGDERQLIRGISLTTPARTAFDLGRRPGRTVALIHVDALANTTGLRRSAIEGLIERHAGV